MKRWMVVLQKHRIAILVSALLIGLAVSEPSAIPLLTSSTGARLLFSDNFNGRSLDSSKWNTYVTSRSANGHPWNDPQPHPVEEGEGAGCMYSAQYYLPSQVRVDNGLDLTATRSATAGWCNQTASQRAFPWSSGAVSTYGHFQFNGGYVAVTMKAPSGNGMWPAVWMLPGPGGNRGDDFEIDLQEGGFAPPGPANETYAWHLHRGTTTWGGSVRTGIDLTSGFHTYAINWVSGQSMTWYLDGREVAKLTRAQASIPNEPMELIMVLAVATSKASGWHTPYDATTTSPSIMDVSSVQVWSAPPSFAAPS